ncbi:hypothetical protein H6789_00550 [Candidatus Nomurabacteria bacterium]|nr:hypothetical protein [Candidatus Nomurabacteria bacterium]
MKTNMPNIDVEKLAREEFENDYCMDKENSSTTSNEGRGIIGLGTGGLAIIAFGILLMYFA